MSKRYAKAIPVNEVMDSILKRAQDFLTPSQRKSRLSQEVLCAGEIIMMKKRVLIFFILFICLSASLLVYFISSNETKSYEVFIESYNSNSVIVEYPQINGFSEIDKQNKINNLLKDEIFQYITNCYNNFWLKDGQKVSDIYKTIDDTKDATLEFICHTGIESNDLLSIRYAVLGYGHGGAHPNTWGFAYTVDLNKLVVLDVSDFIEIDLALLELEGSLIFDRDYNPIPYEEGVKLFDVLSYSGLYTIEEVLEQLEASSYKSCYITEDRGVSFFFGVQNHEQEIEIDFESIKGYLTPLYYEMLINQ